MKLTLIFLLLLATFSSAADINKNLQAADSCYAIRAKGANGDKANAKLVQQMTDLYKKAMSDNNVKEQATTGYIKSIYYSFRFVPFDKNKRPQKLDSLKVLSENAYKQFPKNKEIAHVYASVISMWGNERGAMTSIKEGVATTVKDVATAAEDWQVLGRAHAVLPYIPLVLSWPDKDLADKYLNKALKQDSSDLYNYFFLADFRFEQKRYKEAQTLIDKALSKGVRETDVLEDKRARWHLKELQKKLNEKLGKK